MDGAIQMREQFSTIMAMYECASHEMCPVCTHSNATRSRGEQKVYERARGERFLRYCAQKVPSSTNSQSDGIDILPWILAAMLSTPIIIARLLVMCSSHPKPTLMLYRVGYIKGSIYYAVQIGINRHHCEIDINQTKLEKWIPL